MKMRFNISDQPNTLRTSNNMDRLDIFNSLEEAYHQCRSYLILHNNKATPDPDISQEF